MVWPSSCHLEDQGVPESGVASSGASQADSSSLIVSAISLC